MSAERDEFPPYRVGDRPWVDDPLSRASKHPYRVLIRRVINVGRRKYLVVPFDNRGQEPILLDEEALSPVPVAHALPAYDAAVWASRTPVRKTIIRRKDRIYDPYKEKVYE